MQKRSFINFIKSFNIFEYFLVCFGLILTLVVSIIFKGNVFAILTSLIGVVAVFLNAKGNIIGLILLIIQGLFYAIISFKSALYGEVIIYIGLVMPLKLFGLFQWIKNRSKENRLVVNINKLGYVEILISLFCSGLIFVGGYFLLKAFNTASLVLSTISVVTGILETYYNLRREKLACIVAVINNLVVIFMWLNTAITSGDLTVLPIMVCSFINSISNTYGFFVWRSLYKKQNNIENNQEITIDNKQEEL